MYHKLNMKYGFSLPEKIHIKNSPVFTFISHGNFLIDNKVGPETGYTVGMKKRDALLRAIAEVTERRSSMLGAKPQVNNKNYVETWDLLKKQKSFIDHKYTKFYEDAIDTTGSAIHSNSELAIINALKELLEKNSLFLFWYGGNGFRVRIDNFKNNNYYNLFLESGFNVLVFVNTFFFPLLTVIVLSYKENDQFICGMGSHTNFQSAIDHAFEEAFLIGGTRYYWILSSRNIGKDNWTNKKHIKHVDYLKGLKYFRLNNKNYELTRENLLKGIPKFVKELHVIFIEQTIVPNLKYVRVFSRDLFNCLPLKENLNYETAINQHTLTLNHNIICDYPQCPMS